MEFFLELKKHPNDQQNLNYLFTSVLFQALSFKDEQLISSWF